MKKTLAALAFIVLALAAYLAFWPVPIEPVAWAAPASSGYTGPHATNQKLAKLQHIDLKGETGPEHVTIGPDGKLYTAVDGGKVLRMNPDGSGQEVFAKTGGRVLGFDFDAAGNLIGADAYLGLVSIAKDGKVTLLADKVDGDPIRFADAVAVARNGRIYFTDASTRFGPREGGGIMEASMLEVIEMSASGRVLEYDPATKKTRVIAKGFSFANGIALSEDQQSLFVADTGKFRVMKVPVQGNAPAQVFLDNLSDKPMMRKIIMRLPRALWPIPKDQGHVFAFTEDGKVVADMQDPAGGYPETTSVTETPGRLYIQSLHGKTLAWMARPAN